MQASGPARTRNILLFVLYLVHTYICFSFSDSLSTSVYIQGSRTPFESSRIAIGFLSVRVCVFLCVVLFLCVFLCLVLLFVLLCVGTSNIIYICQSSSCRVLGSMPGGAVRCGCLRRVESRERSRGRKARADHEPTIDSSGFGGLCDGERLDVRQVRVSEAPSA